MDLEKMKRKYAYTLARVGLNVQKGQNGGRTHLMPFIKNTGIRMTHTYTFFGMKAPGQGPRTPAP